MIKEFSRQKKRGAAGMSKLLSQEDLEGRMDCFGEFEATDEICLSYCGVNIACASSNQESAEQDWMSEEMQGLPEFDPD
jgi:hypothetical protein